MTTFETSTIHPASAWSSLYTSLKGSLETCDIPSMPTSTNADCRPFMGSFIEFRRVIIRVGYDREPMDMPKSEMAAEIRARVKRGFGIEDIDAKVSNMYNTPYHLSRHGDEDENILELFSSMKFGVRNRYQAGGTVARKLFAMEAQENMVADVKKICTKSVGIRYPSNGYQEDYEPATFSASQRFSLLQIGEVHWESRSTPMYVHPLDVIAYRPDITDYFNGRPFVLNRVEMR